MDFGEREFLKVIAPERIGFVNLSLLRVDQNWLILFKPQIPVYECPRHAVWSINIDVHETSHLNLQLLTQIVQERAVDLNISDGTWDYSCKTYVQIEFVEFFFISIHVFCYFDGGNAAA